MQTDPSILWDGDLKHLGLLQLLPFGFLRQQNLELQTSSDHPWFQDKDAGIYGLHAREEVGRLFIQMHLLRTILSLASCKKHENFV